MSVTREDVEHVARLARLRLSEDEIARFTVQLNSILEHIQELSDAQAGAAEGLNVVDWDAPQRADTPGAESLAFPVADLAAAWDAGFFTVPKLAAMQRPDGSTTE